MTTTPTRPEVSAGSSPTPSRRRSAVPLRTRIIGLPLLLLISFLVLVPAALIVVAAFATDVPRPGSSGLSFTFENLRVLVADGVGMAALNSLAIALGATVLALGIGATLAFIAARTDAPARGFLYLIGLLPLLLPSYVGALAWSILASPGAGLINVAFRDLGITGPVVDVYSLLGVIAVMGTYYAPYAFLMIHSSMSLMNPDLEDAAGVHGSATWQTIRSITLPLSLPAILGSGLLIFVLVFENFPVSQVLATPGGIDTLPTFIYKLMNSTPSRGNEAAVIAIVLVAVVVAITWMQRRFLASRSFTTVSGKGVKPRTLALGRWRIPILIAAIGYFVLSIVLPLLALLLSAVRSSPYMSSFASLAEPGMIDFSSFNDAVTSDGFLSAAANSIMVSLPAAAGGTALAFVIGYVVYRTRSWGRGALEGVSMVPLAIPHVVLGIGLLWTWLIMPLPVYGTLWVLIVGFVAVQMPQGFRGIAASIRATDQDLEDSAVMLGARRSRAIAVITLPLLRGAVLSTFLLLLMLSMRELTVPLFLYTTDTEILSIAIYDQFENGGALREASATALVYCAIMFLLSYLPRRLGAGSGGHGA
jgi:iron(III) transport system permease protein